MIDFFEKNEKFSILGIAYNKRFAFIKIFVEENSLFLSTCFFVAFKYGNVISLFYLCEK